jgi:hypothetical protein
LELQENVHVFGKYREYNTKKQRQKQMKDRTFLIKGKEQETGNEKMKNAKETKKKKTEHEAKRK